MDKEKLQKAIQYATQNPNSEFAIELKKRIKLGEFNSVLKEQGIETKTFKKPEKESFIKRIGKGLIKSEIELGKSVAGGLDVLTSIGGGREFAEAQSREAQTITQLISVIKRKRDKGEDASRFKKLLNDMKGVGTGKNELLERQASLSKKQVAGQVLGVATDIAGAGTIATKGAGLVTKPTSFLRGALKGAGTGVVVGGGFGATQGLARGLQEDRVGADLVSEVVSGGLVGGALGGVLGGVTGGISGGLRGKALRKQQLIDELNTNPELVAKYSLSDTGKILKDKNVKEVIKQGLPEKQVAVIKNAGDIDKSKFRKMFGFAEKASKDARAVERPSDVVGETIVTRTKHLLKELKKAGKQVDSAASTLKGQRVNPQPAVQSFKDNLLEMGITFKKGKPIFDGSDIEGITPAENLIKKVLKRMQEVSDDANEIHKLKKFIDEQVTFGRTGEGLTGQTERVLKGLRRNIDDLLDSRFTNYNTANTAYSRAIQLLDDTKVVLGRNFNPLEGTVRAGAVARRILGNSANRGDILEYLKLLDNFFAETGGKTGDDILTQVVFADILEDIFGTQATTGLQGQVGRAVEQAGGVVQDIGQGQLVTGLTRAGVRTFQAMRGINIEAQIDALARLIGAR